MEIRKEKEKGGRTFAKGVILPICGFTRNGGLQAAFGNRDGNAGVLYLEEEGRRLVPERMLRADGSTVILLNRKALPEFEERKGIITF